MSHKWKPEEYAKAAYTTLIQSSVPYRVEFVDSLVVSEIELNE